MYALAEDGNAVRTSVHGQCTAHVNLFPTSRLFLGPVWLGRSISKDMGGRTKE